MSLEMGVPMAFFALFYLVFRFQDSLADGEHQMLKFGLSSFGLVMGYQLVLFMANLAQAATTPQASIVNMSGRFVWIFGTVMIVVFMYFLYHLLISYVDWRNWRKSKSPFENTERRYFK